MDAAAVLNVKSQLADLKHEGAFVNTDDQFQLLKAVVKEGLVTDQVLDNLRLAWKLRCSGAADKDEYEGDLQMVMGEMGCRGGVSSGTAETVAGGGLQGCLVPLPAERISCAALGASSADKGKDTVLREKVAALGGQGVMSSCNKGLGSDHPVRGLFRW